MLYELSQDDLIGLDPAFYWLEDGKEVTEPKFIDIVEERANKTIDTFLKDKIRKYVEDREYVIYDYYIKQQIDKTSLPIHVIFPEQLTQNLYKVSIFNYGDRIENTYYAGYGRASDTLNTPVVKINFTFHRDTDYLIKYVDRVFSWMRKDGNWSTETYSDIKVYSSSIQKLRELRLVRSNIVEEAQEKAKIFGFLPQMLHIYDMFDQEVNLYEKAGSNALSQAIANATGVDWGWLDDLTPDGAMTNRAFLSYFFSIGVIQ